MKVLFEFSENGDTYVVIDYGRYVEVLMVLANYDKETDSILYRGGLNLEEEGSNASPINR